MSEAGISIKLQQFLEAKVKCRGGSETFSPADFRDMLSDFPAKFAYVGARCISLGRMQYAPTNEDRSFLDRIAQVAYERYIAQKSLGDAPTLIIDPTPLNRQQRDDLLNDRPNYALIFGAETIYFQDTVHAFAIDSCYKANILGVHWEWLSSDCKGIHRAIIMDRDGLVKEFAFENFAPIDIAQILHLPLANEHQLHQKLSDQLQNCLQINPYKDSSEQADDKAYSHTLWEQSKRGIESPKFILISQNSDHEELEAFMQDVRPSDIVIQPNKGTEGHNVEKFSSEYNFKPAIEHINRILAEDDAIVREVRGNVRYTDGISDSLLNIALRINVAWNGSDFIAESGYAQIAKDENTFVASRGRGGSVIDINKALAGLYYCDLIPFQKWRRFIPTNADILSIKSAATDAAHALNEELMEDNYLKHMGVDILLEVEKGGNIAPVILEANPRPAGLSHSSEIIGISQNAPQQLVSKAIFEYIMGTR